MTLALSQFIGLLRRSHHYITVLTDEALSGMAAELKLSGFNELAQLGYLTSLTSLAACCRRGLDLEIERPLPKGLRRLSLATGGALAATMPAGGFPEIWGRLEVGRFQKRVLLVLLCLEGGTGAGRQLSQ